METVGSNNKQINSDNDSYPGATVSLDYKWPCRDSSCDIVDLGWGYICKKCGAGAHYTALYPSCTLKPYTSHLNYCE